MGQDLIAVMRKFYDAVNGRDLDAMADLVADEFVEHEELPGGIPPTKAGTLQWFRSFVEAFPDFRMEAEEILPAGDKVVTRVRVTGTNKGEMMGMPASGKPIDVRGIDIVKFGKDGKVTEHWGITDNLAMMQQLGVVPEMGA